MAALADRLGSAILARRTGLDLPVIDETGLKGPYDLDLDIAWVASAVPGGQLPEDCAGVGLSPAEALRAVGLKLDRKKTLRQFIIVENALRSPTPN